MVQDFAAADGLLPAAFEAGAGSGFMFSCSCIASGTPGAALFCVAAPTEDFILLGNSTFAVAVAALAAFLAAPDLAPPPPWMGALLKLSSEVLLPETADLEALRAAPAASDPGVRGALLKRVMSGTFCCAFAVIVNAITNKQIQYLYSKEYFIMITVICYTIILHLPAL